MESTKQYFSHLIVHIGKVLKIDSSYVCQGGALHTLGQLFSVVPALLLSVAFAHAVPKEVYGEYKFILSITGILGIFSLSGMSAAITRATSAGLDGTILGVVRRVLKYNAILFPISLIVAGYYFLNSNIGLALGLVIFGLASPIISSFGLYDGFLIGKKDFRGSVLANTGVSFFVMVGLITAMILTTPSPLLLIVIYFSILALGSVFFYHKTISQYHPDPTKIDNSTTTYGAHLSIMGVFSTIADQIDKILIFHYLGAAQLAIYSFAVAIPEQVKGVLKNVTTLMLPRFSERSDKEILHTIWRKMLIFGLATSALILTYVTLAPIIFHVLFPAYEESILYSQIVTLSLIAVIVNVPYVFIQTRMQKKILYGFNISSAIIQIFLFVFLTPTYGLLGAICAIIGSRLYSLVFWICLTILLSTKKEASI